ncbi:MAG: beta-ketoacyl-ACP synthase [Parvibaculum sp.]|jgi:3-oxoacyl-[acyl-carrier-protein] synthase II|uniref:beta-ketoacyl-ACP synthase n=1 Tax=Parvibaculum sp. TaxID=2024848 RepID=UPI00283BFE11|nr:beta-ketoacyl-ACP synthase [Parvibaculum sp.]MDR3500921.1 beta-ketoacyl-ACP synthase [Parvibaculum sp.]
MRRVVVTGMAGITPLGTDWSGISASMAAGRTGVKYIEAWDKLGDLKTRLGAPADYFDHAKIFPRKQMRSMGRVAALGVKAAQDALTQAGLIGDPVLTSGRTGVAFGSSYGSTEPTVGFVRFMETGEATGLSAMSYIKMMSHTAVINIGIFFGLKGRVITTSSACTSGSQAIGYSYEAIKYGHADVMIAGGAEELCPTMAIVFDTLFATSCRNDAPQTSPSPYDQNRDGLVIGEGAAALVLEEREHAIARGATIFAEIAGFGTNMDGSHVTDPLAETMAGALDLSLADAGISADAISFVSGHGTATIQGDVAETIATASVFGRQVPIHSLKGYFGHTLGACGAIEAWLSIEMMREKRFAPNVNLKQVDEKCGSLDYITGAFRDIDAEYIMSNNFAFGGVNTSLILKRAN